MNTLKKLARLFNIVLIFIGIIGVLILLIPSILGTYRLLSKS